MYKNEYEKWLSYDNLDKDLRAELEQMNEIDIEDSFFQSLQFGTGGMRGIVGAGINRMNKYTIRKANFGFATYLTKHYEDLSRGVVIAHDNRHMSVEFAKESACVLASFGIKTYLFDSLRPTPELSFAVRELNAIGGIVVTASHNPPKYNGYKIYDEDGCQLVPRYADEVISYVEGVENLFSINYVEYSQALAQGLIEIIGSDIDKKYLEMVDTVQLVKKDEKPLKIVFTPLHGTSAFMGVETLRRNGFNVIPVTEQMVADPDFSTVASPNPENAGAFEYAIRYGEEHDADILIATDPDADRLGVAVKHNGEYKLLTGNQTGAIMIDYILRTRKEQGTLPLKGMVYDTVVSSSFGSTIAKSFGMNVQSTLTGFKFIGEQAKLIEDTEFEFVFGYEESYGYVVKDFVRDKDSIQALLLISEIANVGKLNNKTLVDYLEFLYSEHGYFIEDLVNVQLEGAAGAQKITKIMDTFRNEQPKEVFGLNVVKVEDYLVSKRYIGNKEEEITLPKSNVLKFFLSDGSWFVLRPSGTEPKLKIYIGVLSDNLEESQDKNTGIKKAVVDLVDKI